MFHISHYSQIISLHKVIGSFKTQIEGEKTDHKYNQITLHFTNIIDAL